MFFGFCNGEQTKQERKGEVMRKSIFFAFAVFLLATAPTAAQNIISNPGFESGADWWFHQATDGAAATFNLQSAEAMRTGSFGASVQVTTAGTNWHVQLCVPDQWEARLGTTYTISFYARADRNVGIEVAFQGNEASGWATYQTFPASLTTTWQQFTFSHTSTVEGAGAIRINIFMGANLGTYFFDDFELTSDFQLDADVEGGIAVNTTINHQTMVGFGAAGAWYENWLLAHPDRQELYQVMFVDLGLDVFRIRNTWGYADPVQYRQIAQIVREVDSLTGGSMLYKMASWSPPASLKSNNDTHSGGTLASSGGSFRYADYADYWYNSLVAYEAQGVVPDFVSFQNEPDFDAGTQWESCLFSPTEGANAGYAQALNAVAPRLAQLPNPPRLIGPEVLGIGYNNMTNYISAMNTDHLYAYAFHLYHGGDHQNNNPDSYIPYLEYLRTNHGDKPLFQTEFDRGDWFNTVWLIHNNLAHGNVAMYLYWELFWETRTPEDKALVILENPWQTANWTTEQGWYRTQYYYGFRHFSRYISRDWVRVETNNTRDAALRHTAFRSPSGDSLTIVVLNVGSTPISAPITIDGSAVGSGSMVQTTDTNRGVMTPFTGATIDFPARSITTIITAQTTSVATINKEQTIADAISELSIELYPNPFNPVTTIRYTIPQNGLVDVSVFDISGRKVNNVFNGYLERGVHSVEFDGRNLSSGIYFCVVTVGNQRATKRMVFLK